MTQINNKPSLNGVDVLVLSPTPTHPLDFGNRKRIHESCRQFKERGGQNSFPALSRRMAFQNSLW